MKILALWTKLNQILYTYSMSTLKARNVKTNHPTWKGGAKNENFSCPLDQTQLKFYIALFMQLTKRREIPTQTFYEKTGQF